ncbi:MAG: hypothetical protein HY550_02955 [Elusimicrobia bacterium]|nr:hypothetical protein [Elusimicrobiota bacterium]
MIKTLFAALLTITAAGVNAADITGLQASKAADITAGGELNLPLPQAAEAVTPRSRDTLTLLDPRNGKVYVVVPVSGGFINISTGLFVPAVYNGSGYVLPSGQYLPVVGGKSPADKGAAMTAAKATGRMSCRLDAKALGKQYTLSFNLKKLAADPENNPIRVSPAQNFLEALNENISVREEKGNIVVSGDSDGFFLVYLTLNTASGFTRGDFYLRDTGEGCGDKRGPVTCSALD